MLLASGAQFDGQLVVVRMELAHINQPVLIMLRCGAQQAAVMHVLSCILHRHPEAEHAQVAGR